jgi:hypothetical protein
LDESLGADDYPYFDGKSVHLSSAMINSLANMPMNNDFFSSPKASLLLEMVIHESFHAKQAKIEGIGLLYGSNFDPLKQLHTTVLMELITYVQVVWAAHTLAKHRVPHILNRWSSMKQGDNGSSLSAIMFPFYKEALRQYHGNHAKAQSVLVHYLLSQPNQLWPEITNTISNMHASINWLEHQINGGKDIAETGFGKSRFRWMAGEDLPLPNLIEIGKFEKDNIWFAIEGHSADWVMDEELLHYHVDARILSGQLHDVYNQANRVCKKIGITPIRPSRIIKNAYNI